MGGRAHATSVKSKFKTTNERTATHDNEQQRSATHTTPPLPLTPNTEHRIAATSQLSINAQRTRDNTPHGANTQQNLYSHTPPDPVPSCPFVATIPTFSPNPEMETPKWLVFLSLPLTLPLRYSST